MKTTLALALILVMSTSIKAGWLEWSPWSGCSWLENDCVRTRLRECAMPRVDCTGLYEEADPCVASECSEQRCPPVSGLIKHYHAWFEITDQKTTFAEAQAYCANRGLTLARMDTEIVADEVVDFIDLYVDADSWVDMYNPHGVTCDEPSQCQNKLTNVDGVPLSTLYNMDMKLDDPNKVCIKLKKAHRVEDADCDKKHRPLCQSRCGDVTPGLCPPSPDMEAVSGNKYFLTGPKMILGSALAFCEYQGLQLASIWTQEDYNDVTAHMSEDVWVDATNLYGVACDDDACSGQLLTAHSSEQIASTSYMAGVKAKSDERCLYLKSNSHELHHVNCEGPEKVPLCEGYCEENGSWSEWSPWSDCTATCGFGYQERSRSCDNPQLSPTSLYCQGNATEERNCSTSCAIEGCDFPFELQFDHLFEWPDLPAKTHFELGEQLRVVVDGWSPNQCEFSPEHAQIRGGNDRDPVKVSQYQINDDAQYIYSDVILCFFVMLCKL